MTGVAAAFLCPSSNLGATAYDRVKHMVPKLAHRGQAGVSVRPHVAIAHLHSQCDRINDDRDVQPSHKNAGTSRHLANALDGALVNGSELREELPAQGHRPDDDTRAELLLNLIDRSLKTIGCTVRSSTAKTSFATLTVVSMARSPRFSWMRRKIWLHSVIDVVCDPGNYASGRRVLALCFGNCAFVGQGKPPSESTGGMQRLKWRRS